MKGGERQITISMIPAQKAETVTGRGRVSAPCQAIKSRLIPIGSFRGALYEFEEEPWNLNRKDWSVWHLSGV